LKIQKRDFYVLFELLQMFSRTLPADEAARRADPSCLTVHLMVDRLSVRPSARKTIERLSVCCSSSSNGEVIECWRGEASTGFRQRIY